VLSGIREHFSRQERALLSIPELIQARSIDAQRVARENNSCQTNLLPSPKQEEV
jgi:hypothetical protein